MSATGRVGPFFFEDEFGDVETINIERYLNILRNKFLPALRRREADINNSWFQQDSATPHTSLRSTAWMEENFRENFISFKTENEWPPHSPDLNPFDFYLWGYLKDRVYTSLPKTYMN